MININQLSVMQEWAETVPKAASRGTDFKRAVAKGVVSCEPPVTLRRDNVGWARTRQPPMRDCLVAEPTNPRLKKYPIVYFAEDAGAMLRVGWYQLGGDFASGHDVGGLGLYNHKAMTDLDASELESIHTTIHNYAVLPALQGLVDEVMGGAERKGFFGA